MKKFIFYTIKSVLDYCCTFSWRFNAGFSSFFWTSAFAKKLFFYVTLLFLVFGQAPIYGQLVGGATVKAGFGIDGDVYANLLQFGNLAGPSHTDDWFNSTYPGNGRGVIKQTDPIPVTPNEAFSFRQSITALNSPYPYPLVPGVNDAGETVNYLWLDAVYGRDNYVKGGSAEKSYFAGSGDKNSDNPSTWSIGTSGSVPQKDDLIDVYAHLRGEGPRIPFTPPGNTDPRPFTTLWAYAGASLVVTNGNKHVDFEFFRTALDEAADLSVPGATGPDGGRTAWTFNPDGTVAIPGTIIVSVDYTNGGTSPQVRIRVWMDETVFNNFNNLPISGRPFTVDPGTFESGTGSTVNGITYGYGVILPNVGTTAIWGRVNDNDSTLGPPWGTFEGSTPDAVTHYQALQFVEIGINLTAFGLDARGSQDPCSNILGSLLVKTRSSGGGPTDSTAFGSELKDFAGPFLFGNTGTPPVVTVTPKTTCSGLQVDLTEGSSTTPSGGVIRYYTDDDYEAADEILNPTTYIPSETMTIYARSESVTNPGCYGTASFIVTVNNQPDAGTDGNTTVCDSSTASIDLYSLITGEDAGGTWTRLTGTGGTFNAAAGTFVPTGATTSTFKYLLSATAPCVADESIATVNVNNQPDAGTDGNTTVCDSSTASIDLYSLISGEDAGGTWTRLTGTGGTFNAAAGTFVPTGATTSTFKYLLSATAPCVADESIATVNVNNQPDAGTDGNTTVCDSSTASIDLYSLITGEDAGGTWTRLTGTGGTFNAAAGTFVPTGATTSTFKYLLSATAPCVADESIATVNVNNQPDAGTDGNTTVCDSSTASIDLYSLISGEDAGGTWTRLTGTGGTFNAAAGTFVPTGATTSTFKYLLSATAPCVADESIATVNVNNQPDAGTDGNTTVCDSSTASINLYSLITGEDAGGTWTRLTGTGGTFNAAAGTFVPTGATTSTFKYLLSATAPCVADESIATVNVNNQPDAGTDGNTTVCDSSTASIDLYSLITGEDAGGTWTRLTGTGGTFNAAAGTFVPTGATTSTFKYLLSATAPCVADESIATVNVNNQPDAGTDGNTTVCDSSTASIDLYSLISGEDAGGTWTRLTGTGGTFNAAAGTFVPTGATTSTFKYLLSATAPCVADESIATVNVNNQPDAGTDGNTTVCDISIASINLYSLITGEDAGGTWTRLTGTGGTFNAAAGTFVPTGATTSTFRYSLSATAPCVADESIATVNVNNQPDAGTDGNTTVCDSSIASIDLFSLITGEDAGGTWTRLTGTGGAFNAAAGTFVPTGATTSTFRYSLSATAPCVGDESITTVNVNNQPDAGTDGNTTVCDSSTASIDLYSLISGEDAGGTWTRLTGTGGTFNAAAGTFVPTGATTSTFKYLLSATAPCVADESIATVNVNNQPDAGTDGNTTVCDSSTASIDLYSLITGEDAGGTWTRLTGTGGTFNAAAGTFVPTGATTSTFKYLLSATAPCVADESIATVNVNNQPDAGTDGNTTVCDSSTASIDLYSLISGEDAGGTWTRLTGTGGTFNAAAGTFVPTGATTSTFKYLLSATAPCVADESIATVNVNNQPDAGTDGNTTVCDSSTASIDLYSLITGEDAGGTWTRLTGTGGTFNAAAGTFVPTGATTSTFKYMLSATAPCVADESIATVNINPTPIALVLTGSTICVSDPGTGTVSSTTSELGVTYQLRIGTTPVQAPQPGTGSALTWINLDAGTNYNVVSTGPAPTNCPGSSNSVDVATEACGGALCTYTQGYYGNPGGLSCAPNDEDGFDKYTTLELIERALASYTGGIMTIGSLGNTVVITNTLTDREAIISVLPGGGSSYVLSGSYSISALPSSYLSKKGTINNTLLAQTITLGLNIGINGALSDFVLQGGVLVTAAAEGGCGSDIPKVRTCNYDINGNLTSVTNDYEYYSIDANVLAAIEGEKTVQGLFDLANKALGGGDTNGVSLTSIADVVDKINNAFDGCRLFIGYDVPKCPTTINTTEPIQRTIETASFDAYPVPFKDELTIKYKFDYVSDVKIDVLNSQGVSVLSKMDNNSYMNKEVTLNLNSYVDRSEVYVVKVTTNRGSSVKKVISSK